MSPFGSFRQTFMALCSRCSLWYRPGDKKQPEPSSTPQQHKALEVLDEEANRGGGGLVREAALGMSSFRIVHCFLQGLQDDIMDAIV